MVIVAASVCPRLAYCHHWWKGIEVSFSWWEILRGSLHVLIAIITFAVLHVYFFFCCSSCESHVCRCLIFVSPDCRSFDTIVIAGVGEDALETSPARRAVVGANSSGCANGVACHPRAKPCPRKSQYSTRNPRRKYGCSGRSFFCDGMLKGVHGVMFSRASGRARKHMALPPAPKKKRHNKQGAGETPLLTK